MKNNTMSEKYDFKPEAVRGKSFESDLCRMKNVFHQLIRVKKDIHRKVRRSQKIDTRKRNKLRVPLDTGEKVLVLAECTSKEDALGEFYKSTTENRYFFRREQVYVIRKRTKTNYKKL